MPEGPECTIVAKQLNAITKNKTINWVELLSGKYLKQPPQGYGEFLDYIVNEQTQTIEGVYNKGKFIYWVLTNSVMFTSLGMTGTFKTEDNKYARIRLDFSSDLSLFYSDMRNFGNFSFFAGAIAKQKLQQKLAEIGPDMLNEPCSVEQWLKICDKRKTQTLVKFLMEQKNVSGVGNIYKSESLFLARLAPSKTVGQCSKEELTTLYYAVKQVLQTSYECGGATIRNYSDLYNNHGSYSAFPSKPSQMMKERIGVMVYGQAKDPYGNLVEKIKLNDGRTTYWSPKVQS